MSFDQSNEIMSLYIDSAKTFIQLSSGAIVLSVTFVEKLSGSRALKKRNLLLIASWALFLAAIGFGALYQYCAIKFLDSQSDFPGSPGIMPEIFLRNPGKFYAGMVFSFYAGAILFVTHAILRLRKLHEERT